MLAQALGEARSAFRDSATSLIQRALAPELLDRVLAHARLGPRRIRVLTPPCLIGLGLAAALHGDVSYAALLQNVWPLVSAALFGLPAPPVTEEAYCQARQSLPLRLWKLLYDTLVGESSRRFDSLMRWKGFRIFALDSATVRRGPFPELRRHFGVSHNQRGSAVHPQGRLSTLYSVLTGIPIRWALTAVDTGEPWAAFRLITSLGAGDLLLADANYKGFGFFAALIGRGARFLVRFVHEAQYGYRRIQTLGPGDFLVEVPKPKDKKRRRALRHLPDEPLVLRLIEVTVPGFRPSVLLTSLLDPREFSADELRSLYYGRLGRWAIETFHRDIKHTGLQLEALRSRSVRGIFAEVYGLMTMVVLARTMMAEAAVAAGKSPMDLSLGKALQALRQAAPFLTSAPTELRPLLYQMLLRQIATFDVDIRPGRRFPRPGDTKPKNKGNGKWRAPRVVAQT